MNTFQWKLINRAAENADKLNDWELGFIGTLQNKGPNEPLSDKQNHCLNKIGNKL